MVLGASGTGKSSLALHLMALGATLVADDRTIASGANNGDVLLSAPEATRGRIEARGVGILQAETEQNVLLALVVDLDRPERDRLPPDRTIEVLGKNFPVLNNPGSLHFPHAILQYLRAGRSD